MNRYYFPASALPSLELNAPPEISFEELMILFEENLSAEDLHKVKVLRRYYDVENVRNMLLHEPFSPYGNLNKMQMEEALNGFNGLPPYFFDYLEKYQTAEDRLKNFSSLLANYYIYEIDHSEGFLRKYLQFDREWRLIFTAMRAKKMGRDLLKELQFEDPSDTIIAELLVQKDSSSIVPPDNYSELKNIYDEYADSPLELMQAMLEWRFIKINDFLGVDLFSIERLLGYFMQLIALERWFELDNTKGLKFVDSFIKEPS
ncbi:MAG: DUF2764 family protein [Parachlamydiales bacterium]|jgi:hypothetical protein